MMDFIDSVLFLTSQIPSGSVTTYREIAKCLGNVRLSRAVGNALNRNPNPVEIPCHRVILSNGNVGGFSRGVKEKIRLLRKEGILIENNKVKDFKKIFFNAENMKKP